MNKRNLSFIMTLTVAASLLTNSLAAHADELAGCPHSASSVTMEDGYKKTTCMDCGTTLDSEYVGEQTGPSCEHVFERHVESGASCSSDGSYIEFCSKCGASGESGVIPATSHNYVEVDRIEPSCAEPGAVILVCEGCSDIKMEDIGTAGHSWGDNYQTTEGQIIYTKHKCETCGTEEVISSDMQVATHTHNYVETSRTESTCRTMGTVTLTCNGSEEYAPCDEKTKIETLDIGEHDYSVVEVPATCTEDGYTKYTCNVCNDVYYGKVELATGHDFNESSIESAELTVVPTCTEDGELTYTCIKCGITKAESIYPTGHLYERTGLVPSTCTTKGHYVYTCDYCDDSYEEEIELAEHSYINGTVVEATCTTAGYSADVCSVCGDEKNVVTIPLLDHNYELQNTVAATCVEPSTETYKCSVCGNEKTEHATKATGHTYGDWATVKRATCTEKGKEKRSCVCGEYEIRDIDKLDHDYHWVTTIEPTYISSGVESYKCSACGDVKKTREIAKLNHRHNYSNEEVVLTPTCQTKGVNQHTCTICGETETYETDKVNHSYGSEYSVDKIATCTKEGIESKKCVWCNSKDNSSVRHIATVEHEYSPEYTIDLEATCTVEGEKSRHCINCDATTDVQSVSVKDHQLEVKHTIPATCKSNGKIVYQCKNCDYSENDTDTLVATGHNFDIEFIVEQNATCDKKGSKSKHCLNAGCNEVTDVTEIDVVDHVYKVVSTTATCTEDGMTTYACEFGCGDEVTKEEKASGHNFNGKKCAKCNETNPNYVEVKVTNSKVEDVANETVSNTVESSSSDTNIQELKEESASDAVANKNIVEEKITVVDITPILNNQSAINGGTKKESIKEALVVADENVIIELATNKNQLVVVDNIDTVTKEMLVKAAENGNDIIIKFENYAWYIDADSVVNPADINLTITMANDIIPEQVINTISSDYEIIQMSLTHDGLFGFDAKLNLSVDTKMANKYANLYYYNNEELEFMQSVLVDEEGNVAFDFTHASDYAITFTDEMVVAASYESVENSESQKTEVVENDNAGLLIAAVPDPASSMPIIPIVAILVVIILVAGTVFVSSKFKEQ